MRGGEANLAGECNIMLIIRAFNPNEARALKTFTHYMSSAVRGRHPLLAMLGDGGTAGPRQGVPSTSPYPGLASTQSAGGGGGRGAWEAAFEQPQMLVLQVRCYVGPILDILNVVQGHGIGTSVSWKSSATHDAHRAASASPGSLLKIQSFGPQPRPPGLGSALNPVPQVTRSHSQGGPSSPATR